MIKSFVEIIKKYNNLKLAILGEGEDREQEKVEDGDKKEDKKEEPSEDKAK